MAAGSRGSRRCHQPVIIERLLLFVFVSGVSLSVEMILLSAVVYGGEQGNGTGASLAVGL